MSARGRLTRSARRRRRRRQPRACDRRNFFSWLRPHNLHPINFSFSSAHFYKNEVTSSRIDMRAIVLSTAELMLLVGAGGAIWGGGSVADAKGPGPDIGNFRAAMHANINVQVGYGS